MSTGIGRDELLHVASLAALKVPDDELPALVEQMQRIVGFVAQLDEVPASASAPPFVAGPAETPLRPDVVAPEPLTIPPSAMATGFVDGYFTVPRHTAMEDR
ncbi:MAG: Asp-tRNA(Asn)/Glu-tRNA(Gln) amidotransferase subunit GatC [Gemmatimonadota bacterium]